MFLYLIIIWNIVVFAIYGYDKRQAILNRRRISERFLLLSALFMGGAGALTGMKLFRHKTRHLKFMIIVPIGCIITLLFIIYIIYCNMYL